MAFLELLMRLRNPFLDYLSLGISYLGTPFLVVGVITFLRFNDDQNRADGMMLAFLFSGLLCQGLKIVFHVPRPWILVSDTALFRPVSMALSTATGYSFPSIHTQSTAALCLSVIYYNRKKAVRASAVVFMALVAFSRMYLGCHTPSDVAAGFLLTLAVTMVTLPLWRRFSRKNPLNRELFAFFLTGFSTILIFLGAVLAGNGTVDPVMSADAFKTAGLGLGFAGVMLFGQRLTPFRTDGTTPGKIIRLVVAAAGALALEFGLSSLLPDSLLFDTLRYALIGLWLFGAAPAVLIRTGLLDRQ